MADKITEAEVGTWLSGHMGWHNGYRVVQRAVSRGFEIPEGVRVEWERFLASYADSYGADPGLWDSVTEADDSLVDSATEHLQSLAPEGFTFVWDAGELSLLSDVDCQELGYFG